MSLFNKKSKYKILFVASEAAPFVKVGGLGEVMHSLPKAMRELGHDVRVMIPKYGVMDINKFPVHLEHHQLALGLKIDDPHGLLVSNVLKHESEDGSVTYFLENMEYYEKRANVYGYGDDTTRWVLLSTGALEFVKVSDWKPDIIVASDWQTGFIPNLIHTEYKDDPVLSKIVSVFSIHNLKHQGTFDPSLISEMNFDAGQGPVPDFFDPHMIHINGMRRGIKYADAINTVSPTYSREIMTEEFGEKLDKLLSERKERLFGILNGIDTESFDPATDEALSVNYSIENMEKKRYGNKTALQRQFGLPTDEDKFVAGMVTRITGQKGLDLLEKGLESLMDNLDFQFIIVGEGESKYREMIDGLKDKYPNRIGTHYTFDSSLPRLIFSGADVMLIPSKFEPSGLVQMEAMRYGCVPIVRKVGGLADSVKDFNPENNQGTGFVFEKYDSLAFIITFVRAFEIFRQKKEWMKLMKRAMAEDFSWTKSAKEYIKVFKLAAQLHEGGGTKNYNRP